jgi:hypothetical protein
VAHLRALLPRAGAVRQQGRLPHGQLNDTFEKFRVAPSEIERLTGLKLFSALPEAVRQDLLAKVDREPVKVHYFTTWKLRDLARRGLPMPPNAVLDPREMEEKPRAQPGAAPGASTPQPAAQPQPLQLRRMQRAAPAQL